MTYHAHRAFLKYALFTFDNPQTVRSTFWDNYLAILRDVVPFLRANEDFEAPLDDVEDLVVQFMPVRWNGDFLWDIFCNMDAGQIWTVLQECLSQWWYLRVLLNVGIGLARTIDDPGAITIVEANVLAEPDIDLGLGSPCQVI